VKGEDHVKTSRIHISVDRSLPRGRGRPLPRSGEGKRRGFSRTRESGRPLSGSLKTSRTSAAESKAAAVRGGPGSWVAVCPSFGREAGGSGRRPGYAPVSPLDFSGNQQSPRCPTRSQCLLADLERFSERVS
jgi:hypothetical protein